MAKPEFFDVRQAPPTEAEIRKYIWRWLPLHVFLTALPALLICSMLLLPGWDGPLPFSFWGCLVLACIGGLFYAGLTADTLSVIPDEKCAELLSACNMTPEGQEYRLRVLSQARKFVAAELSMLQVWNSGRDVRAGCRALYGQAEPAGPLADSNNQPA
jgi:hypothetical protein